MPAGLAVDKGYFEIAHFILGARKLQRDKERLAAAPVPPAPGEEQQAQADNTGSTGDAAGWAVKSTEIAEQPDEGLGGTETAQTESAEQPGQRDAGSRAGRAEIAERRGDSAAAPNAGRPEVAKRADDGEGGWKVKNVEIAEEAGASDTPESAAAGTPPPRSVETAETPRPLARAGLEPPERGLAGTPGSVTPPPGPGAPRFRYRPRSAGTQLPRAAGNGTRRDSPGLAPSAPPPIPDRTNPFNFPTFCEASASSSAS